MKQPTIKAILFDLGNVMVKFDPAIAEKGYSKFGKIKKGAFVDYIMEPGEIDRYMEGKLTSSKFYTITCKKFQLDIKFGEFYEIWNSIFYPYPEMETVAHKIKIKYPEIKLVMVSNTNETHYEFLMKKYDVLNIFDEYVVSHEVGFQKPKPEIFTEALRVAGSVAKETFYVDDRKDLIDAARVMGIRAFQFVGHEDLVERLMQFNVNL